MTIDRERLQGALEKLRRFQPLSTDSIRRLNEFGNELEHKGGESPATIAIALFGGALAALTQVMSRAEIEEISSAMIHAMYGDLDPEQLRKAHDHQEIARRQLSTATGIPAAKLPRLPFERS